MFKKKNQAIKEDNYEKAEQILNIKKVQENIYGAGSKVRQSLKKKAIEDSTENDLTLLRLMQDSESDSDDNIELNSLQKMIKKAKEL